MSLREELEVLRLCEPPVDLDDWNALCGAFLRDHGQALGEALDISEELICCAGHDCDCQGATRAEYQAAMNKIARSKTVDGGGA